MRVFISRYPLQIQQYHLTVLRNKCQAPHITIIEKRHFPSVVDYRTVRVYTLTMDRMVIAGALKYYSDILANVRNDGQYHRIRSLVQVDDPEVREIARVLVQADNFIEATHEFVHSFTTYRSEIGDYWETPEESLAARACDCDGSAILLTSLLRNYIPPEKVYVGFGLWTTDGAPGGHAWVVCQAEDGSDIVLESTAHHRKPLRGKYTLQAMFNDQYCFATDVGVREFELRTVESKEGSHVKGKS